MAEPELERRDPTRPSDRRQESAPTPDRAGRRSVDKIACPYCDCLQSAVLPKHPTLAQQQHDGYWRRRKCGACGKEFPTQEVARPDVA